VKANVALDGHTMALFPVAFLLVFRNGMSFNRYFEGRGHCGSFVHASRNLQRLANTHTVGDAERITAFRVNLARLLRVHTIAQRNSIRACEEATLEEAAGILLPSETIELQRAGKNLPLLVLTFVGIEIAKVKDDLAHPRLFQEMDFMVDKLMEAWMGMHKLATTPMPFPFLQMLTVLMYLWLYTVPFPLAVTYEYAGPAISFVLGTALFGIDAIGAELEDPLGDETNDLPYEVFEGAVKQAGKVNKLGFDPDKWTAP